MQVEARIGLHTRRVVLEAEYGCFAPWQAIEAATAPRGIPIQLCGEGPVAAWETIAPGLRGWGEHLIEVDPQILAGGVAAELVRNGASVRPYPQKPLYDRPGSGLRGRAKDYLGAAAWRSRMLELPSWRAHLQVLVSVAASCARQMSFEFGSADFKPAKTQTDSRRWALSA